MTDQVCDVTLTLPVSELSASTSFYLSVLHPLDYRNISSGSHRTAWGETQTVGLGLKGSPHVAMFLSQSDRSNHEERIAHSTEIVFSALSRIAVRDAYAAALNAGGRPILAPHFEQNEDATTSFAAVVTDPDKNKLRIEYSGSSLPGVVRLKSSSGASASMLASGATSGNLHRRSLEQSRGSSPSQLEYQDYNSTARDTKNVKNDLLESSSVDAQATKLKDSSTSNSVVGALIGAAAGAALAYTMVSSQRDSKNRERDFSSRMTARESLKDEARMASSQPVPRSRIRETSRGNLDALPKHAHRNMHDQDLYFVAENRTSAFRDQRTRTRRSASVNEKDRKQIGWKQSATASKQPSNLPHEPRMYEDGMVQDHRSSHAMTTLPPPSSASRWKDILQPPPPPQIPSLLRTSSLVSTGARKDCANKSVALHSRSRTSRSVRDLGKMNDGSREDDKAVATHRSRQIPMNIPLPPSVASGPMTVFEDAKEEAQSVCSQRSKHAISKDSGKPVSNQGTTVATSSRGDRHYKSAASDLTSDNLAAHNIPLPESVTGSRGYVEDLDTIVPDDSISSVDTPRKARSTFSRHSRRAMQSAKASAHTR